MAADPPPPDVAAPEPPAPAAPKVKPAAWGEPFWKVDLVWTRFETWLAVVLLGLEIVALSLWVILKGLSTPSDGGSNAGVLFRAIVGAMVLGFAAYWGLRKQPLMVRRWATIAGITVGILTAKAWADIGVGYTSNLLNWYQQACTLTLFGGLRGIGTRITLFLAILGGSLATARGKHVTIDLVQRFASERIRLPVVVAGWLGSAVVCLVLTWGFLDHIAIENFGAKADSSPGAKVARIFKDIDEQSFILRKQIALDFKSTPHIVFRAQPYSEWFGGREWNEWIESAGFVERYGAEAVKDLKIPEDDTRAPIVIIPGRGEPRGELINTANLVYPFGFLVIAIRFLLRTLLAISRHVSVDPDDSGDFSTDETDQAEARV